MLKRGLIGLWVLTTLAIAPPSAQAGDETAAVALINRIQQAAGNQVARALRNSFDSAAIARTLLGTYWSAAASQDRSDFIAVVQRTIADEIARRLGRLRSDDFTIVGSRTLGNGDVLVTSRLARPGGRDMTLDWRTRRCAAGTCIVDLIVDGASVTIQRRDEYAARLRMNGGSVADLVASLRVGWVE